MKIKLLHLTNMNVEAVIPPLCHLPKIMFNKFIDFASLLFPSFLPYFLHSFFTPLYLAGLKKYIFMKVYNIYTLALITCKEICNMGGYRDVRI